MKFGGTSMAGTERIRRVAGIVRRQQAAGHEVAVVVSAMAGETDRLVSFCREANRSTIPPNTTWWWQRANRSPAGCWR